MSTLKARFDIDQARSLLNDLFPDVDDIRPVTGGEASQAYTFSSAGRQLVLRVNHHASYQRDAWASTTFRHSSVPAPLIVQTGEHESLHWAVSERAAGSMLSTLPLAELAPLVPRMVEILIAIHDTPIGATTGYGWTTESGEAPHSS